MRSKIKKENLLLLSDEDKNNSYLLTKLLAWQKEWSDTMEWSEFLDTYFYCSKCKSWQEGQCICYAR
jgi:hypothetical protein